MKDQVDALDRPVWHMLSGRQSHLAQGGELAVRIDPRYRPFAAAADMGEQAQAALARLSSRAGELWLVEPERWPAPEGTRVRRTAGLVQMVARCGVQPSPTDDATIARLGESDAHDMAALAKATEPGPWSSLTHRYGTFFGCRVDGTLVAMAGERMQPAQGLVEVSGVCTAPEYRGQGLARKLSLQIMSALRERDETPFLFSYARNEAAIALYTSLGFEMRREMMLTILEPE